MLRAIKCSPDGRYVVSMSADGSIYVWDIAFQRIVGCETKAVPTTMVGKFCLILTYGSQKDQFLEIFILFRITFPIFSN